MFTKMLKSIFKKSVLYNKKAPLLLGLYIFILLFSIVFIALEVNHSCNDNDCPICFNICLCKSLLKNSYFDFSIVIGILLLENLFLVNISSSYQKLLLHTLVTLKIKLSI